ncbi:MAG: hypothetical protein WKF42_00595 [Solirubrobacteraceae bacterium]
MRRLILLAAVLGAAALVSPSGAVAAAPITPRSVIGFSGVGAIEIGSRISVAERRTGQDIDYRHAVIGGPGSTCGSGELLPRSIGFYVLGTNFRIASINVVKRGIRTARGIRVGDSLRRVRSAYGARLVPVRNFYNPRQTDYELRRGNRKLVFFTRANKVTSIRSGRKPEVDYVEGCA